MTEYLKKKKMQHNRNVQPCQCFVKKLRRRTRQTQKSKLFDVFI